MTTIEGIPSKFDMKKILKVIKKQFACNGTIVNDDKAGDVILGCGSELTRQKKVRRFGICAHYYETLIRVAAE